MESTKHTWYGKQSHIFRTDGRVVRATLKQLVLERGAIYIKTEFVDNKGVLKPKTSHQSPSPPCKCCGKMLMWSATWSCRMTWSP